MDDRIFETLGPGVTGPGVAVPSFRDRSVSDTELESEGGEPAPWGKNLRFELIRIRSKAEAMARLHADFRQRYGRPFKARL